MNSFQRALEKAETIKAQKWAAVRGLPRRALQDEDSRITVRIHGRTVQLLRITERQGTELARTGAYRGMHVFEFRRFGKDYKRCKGPCGMFRQKSQFSPDERNADGLHSYCKKCRTEVERTAYRKGRRKRGKANF